jgi:hypothetical protein
MSTICRVIVAVFGITYVIALGLLLVGTLGLFGSPSGPLAGIFLIPLGIPWIFMLESVSDTLKPWLAALTPGLNLAVLWFICRLLNRSMK